jgi:hypothetical protein
MNPNSDTRQAERARLLAERDRLVERLDSIKRDYRGGLDADFEEQAMQLENAEVLEGIARAAREELERVERRLADLG